MIRLDFQTGGPHKPGCPIRAAARVGTESALACGPTFNPSLLGGLQRYEIFINQ